MTRGEIAKAFDTLLTVRGFRFSPGCRLVEDLGMDSQALVSLVLDVEGVLERELNDNTLSLFIECTLGQICTHLAKDGNL
jgi:acyl carrier protein